MRPERPMFKKGLAFLLGLGLIFNLSACSSKSANPSPTPPVSQTTEVTSPEASSQPAPSELPSGSQSVPSELPSVESLEQAPTVQTTPGASGPITLDQIPPYSGEPYIAVHDNVPYFDANEITSDAFTQFFDLDSLGRVTLAYGSLGPETLPSGKRGDISSVQPTGWVQTPYDFITDGGYLYNRCHLIAWSLSGQNDNPKNLMTGTRYFNIDGMTPFENMVRDYIKETGNHVMYRVTPMFSGNDLVARGALIEGYSVEDQGEGVEFCVFAYNVQPGVTIDYATGNNQPGDPVGAQGTQTTDPNVANYVLNTNTHKYHRPDCASATDMNPENRQDVTMTKAEIEAMGYEPCKRCNP